MAAVVQITDIVQTSAASSKIYTFPVGIQQGDRLILVSTHAKTVNSFTGSGWTLMNATSSTNWAGYTYSRTALGTESGTTVTFNYAATGDGEISFIAIRGGTLRNNAATQTLSNTTTGGATLTTTSQTVVVGDLILYVSGIRATSATTPSNNGTLQLDRSDTTTAASIYAATAAGTSVSGSWTPSAATTGFYGVMYTIKSNPAAVPTLAFGSANTVATVGTLTGPGDTSAAFTLAVEQGTATVGTDMEAVGVTATLIITANPATYTLSSSGIAFVGATAVIQLTANPGTYQLGAVSSVLGDYFAHPIDLSGVTGTLHVDLLNSSTETGEPTSDTDFDKSIWIRYVPHTGGTFVLSSAEASDFDYVFEIYEGVDMADLELTTDAYYLHDFSYPSATVTLSVGAFSTYWIRVRNSLSADTNTNASLALSYSLTARLETAVQELQTTELVTTPSSILTSVVGMDPNENIVFTLVGTGVVATIQANGSGTLTSISIPIPELSPGTFTLTATGAMSGRTDSDTFNVLFTADVRPTDPNADTGATPVPQVGVRKWVLQDPVSGGTQYVFPINPSSMKPPHAPRFIDVEHTTSPQGIPVLWEGVSRAHEWEFSGYLQTEAFADALLYFYDLNRRFILIDHRNRAWVVIFDQVDLQPKRNIEEPYAHEYTVKAFIYGEAVQL